MATLLESCDRPWSRKNRPERFLTSRQRWPEGKPPRMVVAKSNGPAWPARSGFKRMARRSMQIVEHALGHVALRLAALVQHLFEHGAGTVRIAHVEVGARQVELGVRRVVAELARFDVVTGRLHFRLIEVPVRRRLAQYRRILVGGVMRRGRLGTVGPLRRRFVRR